MLFPRLSPPTTRFLIKGLGRRFFHSTLPRNKHPTHHGNIFPPVNCWLGSDRNQYIEPPCKVAIVIEGGTYLGYAIANALLGQYIQAVVITSADCKSGQQATRRLNAEHGLDKAIFMQADPTCLANIEEVFKQVFAIYGRADIVVNNPRTVTSRDTWEHDLDMNLTNVFRGTVLALQYLGRGGGGTQSKGAVTGGGIIINSGTTAGLEPLASMPAHTAAQSGVVAATRCFGDQATYKKSGVRVVGLLSDIFVPQEDPCPPHTRKRKPTPEPQHPQAKSVGMASVHLVKRAPSGTIWIVRDGHLHIADFPSPTSYAKVVQKYV